MKEKEKIKAVIFDVGGVLSLIKGSSEEIGHHPAKFTRYMVRKLNIDIETWKKVIDKYYNKASKGEESKEKILRYLSNGFGVSSEKLEGYLIKAFKKTFKRNKKLYRFAFKLKKKGYKIAVLSDQWQLSKKCCMVPKYTRKFDVVVVSCDVGAKKPDKKIFRIVLERLKRFSVKKAGECVFIDNKRGNILSAKKLGMKVILFKSNRQIIKDLKKMEVNSR